MIALIAGDLVTAPRSWSAPPTLTFSPVADTYVRADRPSKNLGSATTFGVDSSPMKHVLLRFSVSGIGTNTVTSAKLLLYNVNKSPKGGDFYRVADNSWGEKTVTWNTAPAADPTVLASLGPVVVSTWYEADLTALVTGDGIYSLEIASTSADGADYTSREGAAGFGPRLVITLGPTPDTTAPLASITSPTSGESVSGTVTVQADASDDVGVTKVELYVDGVLHSVDATYPYALSWNTRALPNGDHALVAVAYDAAGNTGSSPIATVSVSNVNDLGFGRFRVVCGPSHRNQVDPIVNPGPSGTPSAHMHEFFGNVSTDSDSTYESMVAAGTTCGLSADTAGYWIPSLVGPAGEFVQPDRMAIYYTNRPESYGTTTAFPPDFRIIAGGVGNYPHAYWTCDSLGDHGLSERAETPPDCGGVELKLHVFFPSCWDGVNIDSLNHRSHVAYAFNAQDGTSTDINDNTCPDSHPVKIPQIRVRVVFPVSNGPLYVLSDDTTTPHSDFWNTWNQAILEQEVQDCLQAGVLCELLQD